LTKKPEHHQKVDQHYANTKIPKNYHNEKHITGFKLVSVFVVCKVGIQQFYPEMWSAGVGDMSLPSDQHENEDDEQNDAATGEQRDDNRQ